jgi:hypothetical protein
MDRTGSGQPRSTARPSPADSARPKPSLYQGWIANDRQLRAIITQMRQVAAKATELTMNEAKNESAKV